MEKLRFLFLEDNTADAELIIEELNNSGFSFDNQIVDNEISFIDALNNFKPDIVFSDYSMPTYSGIEAINEINSKYSHIPIIIITGSINEETAVSCIKSGAADYILKNNLVRLGEATKSVFKLFKLKKENKDAIQLLKDSEKTYRTLIEQAGDAIFKGDLEGNFIQINSAASTLTGYSKDELLTMNMNDIFSESQLTEKPLQYDKLIDGISVINERNIIKKSGDKVPVEMNSKKVDDNSYLCIIRNLTERKKIEKELSENEQRLRYIIEHSSNLFYMHDIDGKVKYISPQTIHFFDCKAEDLINRQLYFQTDNPINETGKKITQKAIETGKAQPPFKLELRGEKNRKIWVEVHEAPIEEGGKVTGIVGALVDITDWKLTNDKLILSEEKFRKLFSEAPDGIILINSNGVIIDCNQAYCTLLKNSTDKIINTHVTDSISEKDKHIFKEKFSELIKTGKTLGELCLKTYKGQDIYTRRSASALYDYSGEFAGAIVHTHDISEQKKVQDEIKAREARLSAIFKATDNVSFILTTTEAEDSRILEFSQGAENIFGYTKDEIIGKPVKILHTENTVKNFTKYLNIMKSGKEGFKGQTTMVKKSGEEFTALHTAFPIFDENNKLIQALGVTIDITDRKQLEMQLRHSQKMEAIGLMASGIAHNFNNILQAIVGYVDFAIDGLSKTEQRYKDIEQIKQHVMRATLLTKGLLAVGKEQYMEKTDIDLNDIIKPIVDLTNRATERNISVIFTPQENLPSVHADGSQIDQVIMNIFINAKDAMPTGGKIEASTESVVISDDFCSKNAWAKPGKYVLISISDTGHGMSSDTKRRIFEPYFSTKGIDKGTGLGLSTAFGIISQHNGLFNVISEINIGTTFEIFLPSQNTWV